MTYEKEHTAGGWLVKIKANPDGTPMMRFFALEADADAWIIELLENKRTA